MSNENLGQEMGWEDEIANEGSDYEPLPEGTYEFTVRSMERGRFPGSEKMDACPKASLDMVVRDSNGEERHIFDDLILNRKMEWKLSQFFICIGQKKKGEPLRPRWSEVVGSTGTFSIYINEYTDKNGKPRKINRVNEYLAPAARSFTPGKW